MKSKETEPIICKCRRHWTAYVIPALIGLVCIASVVIPIICVLYIIFAYRGDYLALTETKIIGHVGIINTKRLSTPLSRVQGITVGNGLLGKIFRYHTVSITNAGTGVVEYSFTHMAHAREFVEEVEKHIP